MINLCYYRQNIKDDFSPAYNIYVKLYKQKLLDNPKIYTDKVSHDLKIDIPIFHSYYLKNHFENQVVLLDIDNMQYIKDHDGKLIVIYNKIVHDVQNTNNITYIDIDANIEEIIKEKLL